MTVKEESEKASLKLNIQKTKIMVSGPITPWQIDGETMQTVTDFIFLGSKITADGDCGHEIKRHLLLGRKAMTNLNSRDITLPTKAHLVKVMVFPIVMYGYESWTIKKAEHWSIDAFELFFWKRLLRVPWTARRSNQSILKGINSDCSLEGLLLKLQYFGHLMRRAEWPWCWEKLKAGEGDNRGWDGWMASLTQWTLVWANSGKQWRTGKPGLLQSRGSQRIGHNLAIEQQQVKKSLLLALLALLSGDGESPQGSQSLSGLTTLHCWAPPKVQTVNHFTEPAKILGLGFCTY